MKPSALLSDPDKAQPQRKRGKSWPAKCPNSNEIELDARAFEGIYDYSTDNNHGGKIPTHHCE